MRTDIIDYLQDEIYTRCQKPENKFGMGCFYHIESVVKNSKLLAEKNGADIEIAIIAAWLHDIASVTDYRLYEMHHIHGANIAYDILIEFNYDAEKILRIQDCIRNHRGSIDSNKSTIEELCVADADAISHFDNVPGLLYLSYVTKGMEFEAGKEFVRRKLERSYSKLSKGSKEYYEKKYQQVLSILS